MQEDVGPCSKVYVARYSSAWVFLWMSAACGAWLCVWIKVFLQMQACFRALQCLYCWCRSHAAPSGGVWWWSCICHRRIFPQEVGIQLRTSPVLIPESRGSLGSPSRPQSWAGRVSSEPKWMQSHACNRTRSHESLSRRPIHAACQAGCEWLPNTQGFGQRRLLNSMQ